MHAWLVALIVLGGAGLVPRTAAPAPPDDITMYCRSAYPATQAQVRCLFTERSAQERATRTRASVPPDTWMRCAGGSATWAAMEGCLAQMSTLGGGATAVGGLPAPGADAERGGGRAEQGADGTPNAAAQPPSGAASPPTATTLSPSTTILGPQGTAASAAEPARPTRPVTEAEAERHLKGVLERSGEPAARCTKRQYGGGWVTVCE